MENKVIKQIKKFGSDVSPRAEWVAQNRNLLLQRIRSEAAAEPVKIGFGGYFSFFGSLMRQHMLEPVVVMLLLFATFIGSSLTINAAFYSQPGQPLYRVKLALEDTHAALTPNANQKAELRIEFAEKRVAELNRLVAQQDISDEKKAQQIEAVIVEFKNNVSAVSSHLAKLNDNIKAAGDNADPAEKDQAVQMALAVSSKTKDLVDTFNKKVGDIDNEKVKQIMEEAILTAQATGDSAQKIADEVAGTGDDTGTVKGADTATPDGDPAEDIAVDETAETPSSTPAD